MLLIKIFMPCVLLFCLESVAGQLTIEQQEAKEKGIALYNQYKDGDPYLRIAAEAGDSEAQYYLGESLRLDNRYMTAEAYRWYAAAAEDGNYYAMYRLSNSTNDLCSIISNCPAGTRTPSEWLALGTKIAKALAQKGDAEAMYVLYYLTGEDEWLIKAVDAGFPEAQYDLAVIYREGKKFFFPPWGKSERVEELFRKSAEGGFPKGMMMLVQAIYDAGGSVNSEEVRYWIKKAAETGFKNGVSSYGAYLAHEPDRVGFPLDRVKGYALTSLLLELDGGGGVIYFAEQTLSKIAAKMTPEQIEKAKAFAKEWKATHPPLSFFPDKLGF